MQASSGGKITQKYSIVIPAYNEVNAIEGVLHDIQNLPFRDQIEVIVVDDCSSDGTLAKLQGRSNSIMVLSNVQNSGYGFSLKRGIAVARNENIIIIDADGSYPISVLPGLIAEYERGFDMVVGARQGVQYRGSFVKRSARVCFRVISEFTTGRKIPDINSGCRIFKKETAMKFFHTLSSGFSFTTTITLAYMLNSYSVHYVPIVYHKRTGLSKVRYYRDTLRALQIIVESITIYNPLKLFIVLSEVVAIAGLCALFIGLTLSIWIANLFFFTVAGMSFIFAIGLVTTFLKFNRNK